VRVPLRDYWRLLTRYLAGDRGLVALLASVLFAGIVVRLLGPWFAATFIDRATAVAREGDAVTQGQILPTLLVFAGGYLVAGVVDQVLAVGTAHLGAVVAWRATNRLREDAVDHCLRLDLTFHHEHGPGAMVERLDGDVRELNNFFAEFSLRVIGNILLICGVLGVIYAVDWRIGAVFTIVSLAALLVLDRVRGVAAPHWKRSREASAGLYGELEERFSGIPDIRGSGAEEYVLGRFAGRLRHFFVLTRRATAVSIGVGQAAGLVMGLGGVVILAVASAMHLGGAVSLGTVVVVSMYTAIISAPLREIIGEIDDLQRATASASRVQELMARRPSVRSGPGAGWPPGALPVAFENVTFSYPRGWRGDGSRDAEVVALRDVSFSLERGEVLGLMGRTGSGKSTIVRLVLRFYDPSGGRIAIDGRDIREATLEELRRHVGVVTQEVQFFDASVRDNLTLFDPQVPDERLIEVLREVGLGGWYEWQPRGLDTVLTADGGGLSAGEAQLLGVARVFIEDPGVLILDEPTSRLDPVTERLLDAAFDRLLAGRTCLIVAHHLQTLHRADKVLVLRDGVVAEYGVRAELAAEPTSAFHRGLATGDLDAVG
jgi:ATP-binding cassette subfamily B protein